MYLTADPVPVAELRGYGLVADVVPDDKVDAVARDLAERIARHSRAALRHAKEALNTVEFESTAPSALKSGAAPVAAPAVPKGEMLEFDLGGLSLDLPGDAPPVSTPSIAAPAASAAAAMSAPSLDLDTPPVTLATGEADSPLATKLALAEEFNAIGDADGARSLAEEVLAEASGDLKSRAQRLLAEIG